MSIAAMVSRWSETIAINIASEKDDYNQCTYTASTIQGRLIETEEEIIVRNVQEHAHGDKMLAKAKLFTTSLLTIDSKVGNYRIISVKACKDKDNNIQFYKYFLK